MPMGAEGTVQAAAGGRGAEVVVPEQVRRHLSKWIDLNQVGIDGFWTWLDTVLPLLGPATATDSGNTNGERATPRRVRELATDLVDCARERARLTVECEHYFSDNQLLARRVRALEAMLQTAQIAGRFPEVSPDAPATQAAERYLPRR